MFADPQTVVIGGVSIPVPRTGSGIDTGVFKTPDGGSLSLSVSHAYGKRVRRTARLDNKILAPDVMDSSLDVPYSFSVYTVIDAPIVGFTPTAQKDLSAGLYAWLTASSNANLIKFIGGES